MIRQILRSSTAIKPLGRLIACLMLLVCSGRMLSAQVNDAGLWMSVSVEKKLTQKFAINVAEEFRMNENITELGTFFTDAGVSYKINKYFKCSANYRFTNKRRLDDSYSKRHRYYVDLTFRKKFKPIIFQLKTEFRGEYKDINSSDDGKVPSYYSVNKLTIKYDLQKKLQPYLYVEFFSPLKHPGHHLGVFMDQAKYCIGTEYVINRMHTLDFFYLFQKEYNVKDPLSEYVIGVGYSLNF